MSQKVEGRFRAEEFKEKTLKWLSQRSFENACLWYREELLKIASGVPGQAVFTPWQMGYLKRRGITKIINYFGTETCPMQKTVLSEAAEEFLLKNPQAR